MMVAQCIGLNRRCDVIVSGKGTLMNCGREDCIEEGYIMADDHVISTTEAQV